MFQMENHNQMCFQCLEARIGNDYSGSVTFCYGLSDSILPFGSAAVVQLSDSDGVDSNRYILVYLPHDQHCSLSQYIDENLSENSCDDDERQNNGITVADHNMTDVRDGVADGNLPSSVLGAQTLHEIGRNTWSMGVGLRNSAGNNTGRFSAWRTINSLAPISHVCICKLSGLKEIDSIFKSGLLEDHVLSSLICLIEGHATGRESVNFLNLLGIPSFNDSFVPGCLRHPNIVPVLGLLKTQDYINVIIPNTPYTLDSILRYSPDALKSDWHIRFLVYQLLSALAYLHGLGVVHGNLSPSNVMLTSSCWVWLRIFDKLQLKSDLDPRNKESDANPLSMRPGYVDGCASRSLYADFRLCASVDWHTDFRRWWKGELSNFEYLLILNRLAGRRWGDHTFHTVMPWVIDFSVMPDENSDSGWRDLSKSKWRLAKGDEQLDFTYSTSEIPHHVSDECLSELAVCSYKARRLPLNVLRLAVRSVYEPNEYPATMQRIYQWTPDECIPEFYSDPQIFHSVHSGMTDLAVPPWAKSPEDFIKIHRDALESEQVSRKIHHWIDITFGYKMSGQAAVDAKNVMLPSSDPKMPRSMGRRQLFTYPHPIRQFTGRRTLNKTEGAAMYQRQVKDLVAENSRTNIDYLQKLEEAAAFAEHASCLSPLYSYPSSNIAEDITTADDPEARNAKPKEPGYKFDMPIDIDISYLLDHIEVEDETAGGYQELLLWRNKLSLSRTSSENAAGDIFSVGCMMAELYLQKPLFDATSLSLYLEGGVLPELMRELPHHINVIVEACIVKDQARPSAKSILESPFFPRSIKSSYLFLAPLQLLSTNGSRLHYAACMAKHGVLKAVGTFAAEMCAPYCLPLVLNSLSDSDAEWGNIILKEFLKCLKPKAVQTLILPAVQKIIQATGYSRLKVSLLQDSFVRVVWDKVGKQAYLDTIHPSVISNVYGSPHKISAAAASVLLIGSSEELGVPVTINQTIMPLIQCFGKGLSSDGIDALVRIGGLFGEHFIQTQILPLLKNVIRSCIDFSYKNKAEPAQNWSSLALIDCFMTIDGLVSYLSGEMIVKELIEDGNCLHVIVLMHPSLEIAVLQVAATTLFRVCEHIGPDLAVLHVLPRLKELFDELAFSQGTANSSISLVKLTQTSKVKIDELQCESRIDLVLLLYPSFASLLGIEKLRQCCATWLLLEQFLLRSHNWKWEYTGESSRSGTDSSNLRRPMIIRNSPSEYSPAKLLLNGVGWSIPQSQGTRAVQNLVSPKRLNDHHQDTVDRDTATTNHGKREPWFWFPVPSTSGDVDFFSRIGGIKDEHPWKIRASVLYSVRAHPGTLRTIASCQDESTVFTAGAGPGHKGSVQKWDLTRISCVSGYYGHDEVVNDISIFSSSGRVASCDGTVHVWNGQSGKLIALFAESSEESSYFASPPSAASKINNDPANMLNSNSLSSGILTSTFDGSLYTSMHLLEFNDKLVVGTGNGCIRFIDVNNGTKLHTWRTDSFSSGFPSLVSALCSSASDETHVAEASASSPWIAVGLSSGNCKLLDARCGNIISSWKAHDGYITKLAAPEDHLLVSSSLDRTLRIWDLRRDWPSQLSIFRGHTDGVSGFSLWGQDIVSISRNKIGLSSLSKSSVDDGQHRITPQSLYVADRGTKSLSVLSSISILPFSRLFLVGTEDGYLKVCC